MEWEFDAEVFQWRGPAHAAELTYGWGVIPARVRIGDIEVGTSLMPRDDVYLVPLKVALRKPLGIDDGDVVHLQVSVEPDHRRRAPNL